MTASGSAGLMEVKSRIAEIQMMLGKKPTAATTALSASAGLLGASSTFESALTSALGASTDEVVGLKDFRSPLAKGPTGSAVVTEAKKYLGVPYVWGGESPTGLDCSGLLQLAYKGLGVEIPRLAADQARAGTAVPSLAQAKPGDLVAFGSPVDHIGMFVGDNKMIVAPKKGDVVKIQEIYKAPVAIRRITDGNTVSAFPAVALPGAASSIPNPYASLFAAAGAKHGVSSQLLTALAKTESNFNPNAKSSAGAQGLMQFMPGTAKSMGVDPMNPASAIDGAAKMLAGLIKKFGSTDLALAAYNAGPGAVTKYGGIPPYKETQNYVKKINALMNQGVK